MSWVIYAVVQTIFIVAGIRRERAAGLWSGSKLLFALAFAALEVTVICVPMTVIDMRSSYFGPVIAVACTVAALNFVWFIVACRRWRLPDGRTSLEAWQDANRRDRS
ncbi:MAG: hypothetical protein ABR956_06550 [Terracidiphilus sp.]